MKSKHKNDAHVLAIAPTYRGFGFAVLDGDILVDWGVRSVMKDKSARTILKVEQLIVEFTPDLIALEDCQLSRHSAKVKAIIRAIADLAGSRKIKVKTFSRKQINQTFCPNGEGNKDTVAEALAKRFPDEIGFRLPPKRKPWMNENHHMTLFDAVVLGLMVTAKRH